MGMIEVNTMTNSFQLSLSFYRGGWCPNTVYRMGLVDIEQQIVDLGLSIAISPDDGNLKNTDERKNRVTSTFLMRCFIKQIGISKHHRLSADMLKAKRSKRGTVNFASVPTVLVINCYKILFTST
jgi:hypothetical protein